MSDLYTFSANGVPGKASRAFRFEHTPVCELDEFMGLDDFLWDGHEVDPDAWRPEWWQRLARDWARYSMVSDYG